MKPPIGSRASTDRGTAPPEPPRVLVTLHYPLEMGCVAAVLRAVARAYPGAVLGEDGTVWDRPPGEHHEFLAGGDVGQR